MEALKLGVVAARRKYDTRGLPRLELVAEAEAAALLPQVEDAVGESPCVQVEVLELVEIPVKALALELLPVVLHVVKATN